jgi:hypothetical protein
MHVFTPPAHRFWWLKNPTQASLFWKAEHQMLIALTLVGYNYCARKSALARDPLRCNSDGKLRRIQDKRKRNSADRNQAVIHSS